MLLLQAAKRPTVPVTATANASPEDIAAKIKESVTLTDMQPLSESDISSMYGIDLNDVTAFAGEIDSTGLRTDEFLIIEAKNNESADRILTKMKARQTQRMNEAKTIIQKDMQLYKRVLLLKKATTFTYSSLKMQIPWLIF